MSGKPSIPLPNAGQLKRAMRIYLALAYPAGNLPEVVGQRQQPVLAAPDDLPIQPEWFEVSQCDEGTMYRLRLGQEKYPHMKISLMPSPDATGYLYFADAHDSHLHAPTDSPDYAFLVSLRKSNSSLASAIEKAWTAEGLPTFLGFLRDSLNARRSHEPV